MTPSRHQLPASSPVTLESIGAGIRALADPERARAELRALVRESFRAREVLLVDSGTSALRLALTGARAAHRTPVALPGYCCYDVATAAEGAGVSVRLYDVDPGTLSPDPSSLEAALEAGARTVVVAHLFGVPVDLTAVRRAARAYDALVVEDAAQGIGARFDGRPLGSHGTLAVLSFGRGKGWTGGGGGALLANDEAGVELIGRLRGGGRAEDEGDRGLRALADGPGPGTGAAVARLGAQWLFGRPGLYGVVASMPFLRLGETVYRQPWGPTGMPSASAAAVVASRRRALSEAEARAARGETLARLLDAREDPPLASVSAPPGARAGYLRFPVVASSAEARAGMLGPRGRRMGIMAGYPRPLAQLDRFRRRCVEGPETMTGAGALADRLLTLPTHGMLSPRDHRALEAWIRESPEGMGRG